jgi:hypothetical protein
VDNAVTIMEEAQLKHGISYQALCQDLGVPYGSFMRWRARRRQQRPVLEKSGPKKTAFELAPLIQRIREQAPGPQRCPGAGALYDEYRPNISRLDLRELTHDVYLDQRHEDLAGMTRITWHYSGASWAMDDLHVGYTAAGDLLWNTAVQDLASCYKLPEPLLGAPSPGAAVAEHLDRLFAKYGAPLVLKEDNGSNLYHPMVLKVCDLYGVIPLPSPACYPRFNGAIEHGQGELRGAIVRLGGIDRDLPIEHAPVYIIASDHDLNHKPRRCLHGKTACWVFTDPERHLIVNRRTRKDIHDTIHQLTAQLLVTIVQPTAWQRAFAYRQVVESVLQERGFFSVSKVPKVSTDFDPQTIPAMSL